MLRNNRRGDAFLLVLDLIFLTALIFLFWKIAGAFTLERLDEPIGSRQAGMLRAYDAADAALLYLDTLARRESVAAIREVADAGAVLEDDMRCGTYASLQRWTSLDATCFPDAKILDALRAELQSRLRIATPWIIPAMPYDISFATEGTALHITGTGSREVTLPILVAKGGDQRGVVSILEGRTAVVSDTGFPPDARIPVTVRPTPGGTPRLARSATRIVIHATGTADAASALARYDRGVDGAHYLIGPDGTVTQLVREDLRVRHLPGCETAGSCSIAGVEDASISIALVAPGPITSDGAACPEGLIGPVAAGSWCGQDGYPAPAVGCPIDARSCWEQITRGQHDALVNLTADIARRRAIIPSSQAVLLAEQIDPNVPAFGPGLVPRGTAVDARSWWLAFLTTVRTRLATEPVSADEPSVTGGSGLPQLALPVSGTTSVSSCYGWRTVNGNADKHDGIDFPGGGLDVLAAASGVVYSVCVDGVCDGIADRSSKPTVGFGNNIIVAHENGLLTRYSHLSSAMVSRGDRVIAGQVIGKSGSTGRSTSAHLDFKVYLAASDIPEIGGVTDKAADPLCFLLAQDIRKLSFDMTSDSCAAYGGAITPENERLRTACAGFDIQPSAMCGIGQASVQGSDEDTRLTTGRLSSAVQEQIRLSSIENKVDERLVLAIITQESKGDPNAVSWTGCAGLGQFCKGTASSPAFQEIFGAGLRTCDCPGSGSCTAETAGCAGDPRFDPMKSARAIPLHLKLDAQGVFSRYSDKWRFSIASYNAGGGNIRAAIRASGIADPTWEQIVPHLRGTGMGVSKTDEVVNYVEKVTGYWAALGGDSRPALAGTLCTTPESTAALVREVGSYSFTPSFSVDVPNSLSALAGVSASARSIYQMCDGRDGTDPNACLVREARESFGDRLVMCSSGNESVLQDFREFVADCRGSDQRACGCAWDLPELPTGLGSARLDLYGTDARLIIDDTSVGSLPSGARTAQVAALPSAAPRDAVVSITLERASEGTRASLITWRAGAHSGGDGADDALEIEETRPIDRVLLRPDGTWLIGENVPVCAPHKREHSLCVDLGASTRGADGTPVPLVARFALLLDDVEVPTAPSDVRAAQAGTAGYLGVSFTPSASADISHYRIWCVPEGLRVDEAAPYSLINATSTRAAVRLCSGQSITAGTYRVRVVPYDVVGQRGIAAEGMTTDPNDQGWIGIITNLGEGFSEDDFLDALVGFYTGGVVTP